MRERKTRQSTERKEERKTHLDIHIHMEMSNVTQPRTVFGYHATVDVTTSVKPTTCPIG